MLVEFGRLDRTHQRSCALAAAQLSSKQPVLAIERTRGNLVFTPIIVNRRSPVVEVAQPRWPAFEAVIQCFGDG